MSMLEAIQQIAGNQMQATQVSDLVYGTVMSANPLKVQLDRDMKIVLDEDFLLLTKNVQDYETAITIDGITKRCIIHNSLNVGDRVGMVQKAGGQQFIILDKV